MSAQVIPLKRQKKRWERVLDSKDRPISDLLRDSVTGLIYGRKQFRRLGIPSLFRSTGETTIGRAKSSWDLIKQAHINKHLGVDDSHVIMRKKEKLFSDCCKEILSEYTPTLRKGTQDRHKYYIPELSKIFGAYDPNAITVPLFNEEIRRLRRKGKRKTFFDYAKFMNIVMHYAYERKYTTHDITFPNPDKKGNRAGRVYTDAEITDLWNNLNDDGKDLFVLCYECFMRLREAMHLTWSRVDLETGYITLRASDVKTGSKTGKGREFQMSPHALKRLRDRRKMSKSAFVFPSPRNPQKPQNQNKSAWGSAKADAKIKGRARWHDLRHTALTKALLVEKQNPIEVSEYAGVSMRTIQEVYLHSKAEHTKGVAAAIKILV